MVVFTCNHCGDSLQKPKVAKHYQFHCRNGIFVTCVDCHKDFYQEEYVEHTKCITENERYGGKDYQQKPSANKGEKKQQAWLNIVQNVLSNSKSLSMHERNLLNSISKHENIPRKKAKFLNFIFNVCGNRVNMQVVESVWTKMESAFKATSSNNDTNKQKEKNMATEENQTDSKIINKDITVEDTMKGVEEETNKQKKSKKRKLETDELSINEPLCKMITTIADSNTGETTESSDISQFSWKNTILKVVSAKGEITVKKLKKKVVSQYLKYSPDSTSEKANKKFDKRLGNVCGIIITDEKVRLE